MATLTSRLSQALHTYGAGAIADFPNLSLVVLSPDIDNGWGTDNQYSPRIKIEDDRLAAVFGVDYFVQPPLGNLVDRPDQPNILYAIKSIRFPNVLQCHYCKGLFYINEKLKIQQNFSVKINNRPDDNREGYICPSCENIKAHPKYLSPVRFVIATEDGHLDDFPWDWYVHRNSKDKEIKRHSKRKDADNTHSCFTKSNGKNLKLDSPGKGPSLGNLIITCTECNASESIGGIFDQEATFMLPHDNFLIFNGSYLAVPHKGLTPIKDQHGQIIRYDYWRDASHVVTDHNIIKESQSLPDKLNKIKAKYPRTLQRGAGNIYFPVMFKGISLPDYSVNDNTPIAVPERFMDQLAKILKHSLMLVELPNDDEKISALRDLDNNDLTDKFGHAYDIISIRKYISILYPLPNVFQNEPSNKKLKLRREEFDCFIKEDHNIPEKFWYESRMLSGNDVGEIKAFVDSIVMFDKIREVRVLKGFTRIRPLAFDELIFTQNKNEVAEKYHNELGRIRDVRINDGAHNRWEKETTPWLPAIEVKGEGFFLKFNNDTLNNWYNKHQEISLRTKRLQNNYINSLKAFGGPEELEDEIVNARYILLHTISHILIDALVADCGYNAVSLNEIIYCSKDSDQSPMNGILIYTSSPDSEGTLGGLVEQSKPQNINRLFRKAIEKAKWCSSDPLCIETEHGQGFMGVNMAACHSCCMLPETSCENVNKFLDRALIVGTLTNPEMGLFRHIGYI